MEPLIWRRSKSLKIRKGNVRIDSSLLDLEYKQICTLHDMIDGIEERGMILTLMDSIA